MYMYILGAVGKLYGPLWTPKWTNKLTMSYTYTFSLFFVESCDDDPFDLAESCDDDHFDLAPGRRSQAWMSFLMVSQHMHDVCTTFV